MFNNDILRRVRYALNISNPDMSAIFKLAGYDIKESEILDYLKKEEEENCVECPDRLLELFLDGLIIMKRGVREIRDGESTPRAEVKMSNNAVLKKLKIALNYKENDMHDVFKLSGFDIARPELSAFFRKKGHKNYKVCGDQVLKKFLQGLTLLYRK